MLSKHQLDQYQRDGVLLVEGVTDKATLAAMRHALADLVDKSRLVTQHNAIYDLEPTHSAERPRLRRVKHPHLRHSIFNTFARSEPLVGILKQLLGPDIRMHSSKLNVKSVDGGSGVEWHQDWAFHPHTNSSLLAVGLMMEDCRMENGPMLVIPGSHKGAVHDHNANGRFCGAIDPDRVSLDYEQAMACVGKAGTLSIHHAFAVHGSANNTSQFPRPLLLYEFMSADNWPLMGVNDLAEFDSRMICGQTTYLPRLEAVAVRLPLPAATNLGSIYENQTQLKRRYFAPTEAKARS
ncbi:MAG TPA: phytanoyl-CoA dioxygenase family protein [Steroidobacteraceae bacterium]|nr:phytanoyl-CoA dioxygenase family protein [Steroidobacteraceae bacterium]